MTYHKFAPDPTLQQDIACLWMLDETQTEFNRDPTFPDSYVELIFNCGAPVRLVDKDGTSHELPRVFLNGPQKGPLHFQAQGQAQLIAVRFYPWSIQPLLNSPTNSFVSLGGRWDALGEMLATTLHTRGETEVVATLQQIMVDAYRRVHSEQLTVARTAGKLLYASSGLIPIEEVADRSYLSLRHLERRFKEQTGLTPKNFARLIRYEAVRNRLFVNPTQPLVDLVYEFGYTDQAHLAHEFKTYTSLTLREFAARVPPDFEAEKRVGFLQDP